MGETFVLVEFLKTNDVAVIPSSWLVSKDKALWPPYLSSTRINNAVRNRDSPCTEWTKYSVKIMYESDTYERARAKLSTAMYHSDLLTEDSEDDIISRCSKRKRRSPSRYTDHESSEEDCFSSRAKTKASSSIRDVEVKSKDQIARPVPPRPSVPSCIVSQPQLPPPESLDVNARDARIFMVLEELRAILHSHSTKLNTLLRHHSVQEQDQAVPEGIHFPVKDMNEMEALESKLMDPDLEKKVIASLYVIGGSGLPDTVRRILRYTVSNSLAIHFNWCGKGMKRSFCTMKLKDTIIKSVRKNAEHKSATAASIEKVMKEWFRTARDRDGGRRRRDVRTCESSDTA